MSEEIIEQIKAVKELADLPPEELTRIAELTEKLSGIRLFESLSIQELASIAAKGRLEHRECGDMVIRKGDEDKLFYVILKGQVRVWREEDHRRRLLNYHDAGDFFGELALLEDQPRAANVDVVEDADLVVFDREGFERIIQHQQIANFLRNWGRERIRRSDKEFPGKQWDEVAVVTAHKSWVYLLRIVTFPVFIVVMTLVVSTLLLIYTYVPVEIVLSVLIAIVVGMGLWIFWMWEDWRNDDFIVTSKRIIHIERILVPPFPTERHEVSVDQVQDIVTRNHGLFTWLFNVHSLEIKTIAGTINFPYVDHADKIREEIFHARRLAKARRVSEEQSRIRRKLLLSLDIPAKEVTPIEEEEPMHVTPERTGLLKVIDYFTPRTWIVKPDRIIWRKHWLVLFKEVAPPLLLLLLSLALLAVALIRPWILWWVPVQFTVPIPALLTAFSLGWYLWRYDGWRNDIYIVTDSRIIDIEGSPFHLHKEERTEGTFDIIQSTDYNSPNWFARVLRIGDVTIDTAAERAAFTFDSVARPEEVQQEIFKRLNAFRERRAREESERQYNEFAKWFATYHRAVIERKE